MSGNRNFARRIYRGRMPLAFSIDKKNGVLYLKGTGELAFEELVSVREKFSQDADFHPSLRVLCDFSLASTEMTPEEVRKFGQLRNWAPEARIAVVVSSEVLFGTVRMYQEMHDLPADHLRVFRDLTEAREWLGLSD
ncbi:STAS/SEC14 domain-containing protein [Fimbriimonadia bacterium ATM]|nr:MAG: STAS/SEC14 domain-containing protein [Armatimonadota bacterium]MBC6970007.1 STAS/SEC14 domain-containing protein [Armatimonadota bacterium]MCE7900219.1 STAS/SEC14 domain-containing protein [Armatimonadetes bacterium ATM1]MDL1928823.1 STAS/SEC14 domain-containing protein [Fimbriimonadia bacterium ATM]RIJ96690.1 MAG: hypothetical protein DCC45_06605 [Armatimonadota bacterium]